MVGAKRLLMIPVLLCATFATSTPAAQEDGMLVDDFSRGDGVSRLGTSWRPVSDQVMGGVSRAQVTWERVDGRDCMVLRGDVRLENNGGFIQAAIDLKPAGGTFDASAYSGVRLVVRGNDERYSLHLRTPDNVRPWQSYRSHFNAGQVWQTVELPFNAFEAYRVDAPLDRSRLRRLGLVAIGRAFSADLQVCEIGFY